jgi:hypothetical protein
MPLYLGLNLMLAVHLQNVSCAYWNFPGDNWAQVSANYHSAKKINHLTTLHKDHMTTVIG